MTYANAEERCGLIAGLRELADFLEGAPEVPAPPWGDVMVFPPADADEEIRAEIDRIAALVGAKINDRTSDHGHYTASRGFGRMKYEAVGILARSCARRATRMSYAENIILPDAEEEG